MSFQQLLRSHRVQTHVTSRRELDGLRTVVARDLTDGRVPGLPTDRQFATAYNAVLQLAKMAIACAGYRVLGTGHHQTTFEAVELVLGPTVSNLATYFDMCRRKRNILDYDTAQVVTDTEAHELVQKAEEFRVLVEQWVTRHHPQFGVQGR